MRLPTGSGTRRRALPAAGLATALVAVPLAAMPFRPDSDATVLERVRPRDHPAAAELRDLSAQLRDRPGDLTIALRLAQRHIAIGRTGGDPRHVAYAEATLAPWLSAAPIRPEVLLLRATIRQSRHDFLGALGDLDAVITRMPGHAQARLTRATVHLVRGDPRAAAQDCAALVQRTTVLVAVTCAAAVAAVSGNAARSAEVLAQALEIENPVDGPGVRAWALGVLAETNAMLGATAAAERHFRAALAIEPDDVYLTAALADLLLESGRPAEARRLAERDLRADPLLLRAALAARAVAAADAGTLLGELVDRLADAARRGDTTHLREAARMQLSLMDDAGRALETAVRNWGVQREPADARLLLQAALAACQPAAAQPVLAWMDETRIEDVVLRELARRIRTP